MSEKVVLETKRPELFGDNNNFMMLGIISIRGDKFAIFMSLLDGQVYIEETFTAEVMGEFMLSFHEVKDDKLWGILCQAATGLGITSKEHITNCVKQLGLSKGPIVQMILKGQQPHILTKD